MKKLVSGITLLCTLCLLGINATAFGQNAVPSLLMNENLSASAPPAPMPAMAPLTNATGHGYWGFDLGATYNWYSGGSNFFWPIGGTEADGAAVFTTAAFDGFGTGAGFIFGIKGALALSNSVDLEAKLRYLTNYTSASEDHVIPINLSGIQGGPTTEEPVTNSYNLLLSNLDLSLLAHYGLSDAWYLAGGFSFSDLLSNKLFVSQTKNGGDTWSYYNRNNGSLSGDTAIAISGSQSNLFSNTRLGLQLGGGTVFPIGSGNTLLDAELLVNIPLTAWLQSDGENTINTTATSFGLPSVTFPKQWYASLTIGIRFPFGGNSGASAEEQQEATEPDATPAIGSDGKVPLTGTVTDANTGDPVDANLTVVDLTNNQVVATDHTDPKGRYNVRVKAPGKYSVTADADGHLFGTSYFEVDPQGRILARHPDIKLNPATGRTRLLVFFDFGKSTLKPSSYPELNRAVRLMKAVPTMTVEIAGYTDNIGADDVNMKVSQQRANAVQDYLVQNGIDKSRISAKGYGKDSPISDNGTDDGRGENRRVEFVVLSK
jgi:outer membrane protein OmpA-like peptidoglycan-associated protein